MTRLALSNVNLNLLVALDALLATRRHRWLRELIVRVTAKLGTGARPERTRWTENGAPRRRSKKRSAAG